MFNQHSRTSMLKANETPCFSKHETRFDASAQGKKKVGGFDPEGDRDSSRLEESVETATTSFR